MSKSSEKVFGIDKSFSAIHLAKKDQNGETVYYEKIDKKVTGLFIDNAMNLILEKIKMQLNRAANKDLK